MSTLVVPLPGIDSVVAAAVAWLDGPPLRDALFDVQRARQDMIELPPPAKVIGAEVNPYTIGDYPAILVLGGDGRTIGDDQAASDFDVHVLVMVLLAADEPVVLATQLQRYLLAVRLCFQRTTSFYPLLPAGPSRLGAMMPDPTAGPIAQLNNRYLKAGSFDFTVTVNCDS